jgi:hypothetical protein
LAALLEAEGTEEAAGGAAAARQRQLQQAGFHLAQGWQVKLHLALDHINANQLEVATTLLSDLIGERPDDGVPRLLLGMAKRKRCV